MLKIKDLTVQVLDKVILEHFDLEIQPGEIHALMGPNGAGKSTISKVILRDETYQITNGSISYQGEDLQKKVQQMSLVWVYLWSIKIQLKWKVLVMQKCFVQL